MEQIGRYRILDELGRGAAGIVYRAQDPAIGRIIAIKTIRLSDITDEAERARLRERLFREAQSAGILSHPNIVTIYDIAEANGLAYIFMEFVDGPPLEKVLNSPEPLDGAVALSLLRQTAVALDYAHKKGIVHRDIKPANILIHEGTLAKVTDFGVAKILSQQMTQAGVMMGTPNYMSPEQVQGHAVDGRADQFALAVIAYEILTGEKPFIADQLPSLLYRIVREEPVPPQRLNPTLGFQFEAVLKRALSKSAADRYPTCVDFVDAFAAAGAATPGWHPLPRSSSQTLPTMAGAPLEHKAAPPPMVATPPAPLQAHESAAPPYGSHREDRPAAASPLLRSMVWMLIGIGLVGLVLFGAQKYLFNRGSEAPAAQSDAQNQPPAVADASKPSPVGEKAPDDVSKQAPPIEAPPPPANQEKSQAAADPQVSAPPETHAEQAPAIPPPAAAKSTAQQSVQFVTDPSGAKITIDANPSQACKTPCIMTLAPGRHALSTELAGYRSYPRVFNVPQDGDIFLSLMKATGTLSVTSNPAGASIEIDGKLQSNKTPAVFNFAPGTYHVKVARSGAFLDFDVQIRDGDFINKRVDF